MTNSVEQARQNLRNTVTASRIHAIAIGAMLVVLREDLDNAWLHDALEDVQRLEKHVAKLRLALETGIKLEGRD